MGQRTSVNEDEAPVEDGGKSWLRDYAETILVCVIFVIFTRAFVFQQSEIPSGSMEDTILEGDYILVNRFQYAPTPSSFERALLPTREIRRQDVVVFKKPNEPETDYIKRVIGLPGDVVDVRNGYVRVNGELLEEPYVGELYHDRREAGWQFGRWVVPEDAYFVMGDHRNSSRDSRDRQDVGFVPAELIKGRAFIVLLSTRAELPPDAVPGQVTVGSLWRKIYNLVFHNRIDRALRPIR